MGIEEGGIYGQVAGFGVSIGIGDGLTVSGFAQGSVGVAGFASYGISIDPRDIFDPNDNFIDFTSGTFVGLGTVTGMPGPAVVGAYDPRTGAYFGSIGGGVNDYFEIGAYAQGTSSQQDYGPLQTFEKSPSGNVTVQSHMPIGTTWQDGAKVDILHTTTVVTDASGKVISRSQTTTTVTSAELALATIKDAYSGSSSDRGIIREGLAAEPKCFPAGTDILLQDGSAVPIEEISIGDEVLVYDYLENGGRGELKVGCVTKTYQNVSSEWVRLEWSDADGSHVLISTPGHLFLDETGGFTKIGDLLRLGGNTARVINDKGEVITVKGEWLYYSAETAHLFERASTRSMVVDGNTVFREEVQEGWRTYNFEVEGLHTYVAGGVRVHNHSGPLGDWANRTDGYIDNALGIQNGGFLDKLTDIVTSPIHAAGQIICSLNLLSVR